MILYTPDSARYLAWANSLAHFEGFKDATSPEPVRYVFHAPLYPILLAPSAFLVPFSIPAAKVTTLLIGALLLFCFHRWTSQRAGAILAAVAAVLLAFNPLTLLYSTQVLSDVPFAVCLVLFFMLAEPILSSDEENRLQEVLFIMVILAGIFLREVGLTMMFAAVSVFVLRKQYRRALTILLSSAGIYLIWYLRNDLLIAGIEQPPMTNSRLFFTHLYTSANVSLVQEFAERCSVNGAIYRNLIGKLVFFPDFIPGVQPSVVQSNPLVHFVLRMIPILQYPAIVLTLLASAWGLLVLRKNSRIAALMVIFLLFYFALILLYPINDIRFLFPALIIILFCSAVGLKHAINLLVARSISPKPFVFAGGIILAILAFPNFGWTVNFVQNNWLYARSTAEYVDRVRADRGYPERFAKPIELAGAWIAGHSSADAAIVCRRKEIFFSSGGRKVVDPSNSLSPDSFDQLLRDYGVRFVVTDVAENGLREDEQALCQSAQFELNTAFRVGNIEVVSVEQKGRVRTGEPQIPVPSTADTLRWMFRKGIEYLHTTTAQRAESLFHALRQRIGGFLPIVFFTGVSKEFEGDLIEAGKYFQIFRSLPQGGRYVQLAAIHLDIIARLEAANTSTDPQEAAALLHSAALWCWELGFRQQSIDLLQRSIHADTAFAPSFDVSSLYLLRMGDTVAAKQYLARSARLNASNVLSRSLSTILRQADSLRFERNQDVRDKRYQTIVDSYAAAGLRGWAIDELLVWLGEHPDNLRALHTIAGMYESQRQYAVMRTYLLRILAINPSDAVAAKKLQEYADRW